MRPAAADIVAAARSWLGTPYRHRASVPGAGCDCLGLVRGVWRTLYGSEPAELPHYSADWRRAAREPGLLEAAETLLERAAGAPAAGQLVLFRLGRASAPRHCGIMVAPGRFIHAQEGLGVVEANMDGGWQRRLAGAFVFPERGQSACGNRQSCERANSE